MSAADIGEFEIIPNKTEPELREFCKTEGLDFNEIDLESLTVSPITKAGNTTTYMELQKGFSQDAVTTDVFPLTFVVSFSMKAHTVTSLRTNHTPTS